MPSDSASESPGIGDLLARFSHGEATPQEVVYDCIRRIQAADDRLGSVESLHPGALAAAGESESRWKSGTPRPLEGVPFGVKDVFEIAGSVTTFGSAEFVYRRSVSTADAIQRLLDAGAVLVAKLRTYEFAAGPNDLTRNPWSLDRSSGGSSSGPAAAVGAGLLPLTIGTDTGGSVRVPAAWCGVVGLKPTLGAVSCKGVAALSWTLDHVGPLTRSVADAARAFEVLAERSPLRGQPLEFESLSGLRMGVPSNWFMDRCESEVRDLADGAVRTLASLGAEVVQVRFPILSGLDPDALKHILVGVEAASLHEPERDRWSEFGRAFHEILVSGSAVSGLDYVRALRLRALMIDEMTTTFGDLDFFVSPTSCIVAPPVGAEEVNIDGEDVPLGKIVARNTSIFNVCGFPALSVPCGVTGDGLPVGLQISASPDMEPMCFRVGAILESSLRLQRTPPAWAS